MYTVIFDEKADKDFRKLPRTQEKITKSVREKLNVHADIYLIPLTGDKTNKYEDDYLFTPKKDDTRPLTVRWYSHLVKEWCNLLGLDPKEYSTHSIRRTRASLIYRKTGNIEAVRLLLGQKSVSSTSTYLNVDKHIMHSMLSSLSLMTVLYVVIISSVWSEYIALDIVEILPNMIEYIMCSSNFCIK
jgi:integrase